jgi:carbonic anhydrase
LTPAIRDAWAKRKRPTLHGLIFDVGTDKLREVVSSIDSAGTVTSKLSHSAFI